MGTKTAETLLVLLRIGQKCNTDLCLNYIILPRLLLLGKPLTTEVIIRAKQIKSINFRSDGKHLLKGGRRELTFIEHLPRASSEPGK